MYGTTLLLPSFCLTAIGNLWQCEYTAPNNVLKIFGNHLTNFYVQPLLLPCPGQPSFSGVLISPNAPEAAWRVCLIAFCCAYHHLKPMWPSCQPISGLWLLKILLGSQVLRVLGWRYLDSLECHKMPPQKSNAVFVRASVLPKRNVSSIWRRSHQTETVLFPICIMTLQ